MIRPFTCLCMVLAAVSGLYLYQTKHRTRMLDAEIARTLHAAEAMRARTGVLRAEWEVLNQPDRLADLASHFLALKPLAPSQFVSLADLDRRLPPIMAAPPATPVPDQPASPIPMASADPGPTIPVVATSGAPITTPSATKSATKLAATAVAASPPRLAISAPVQLVAAHVASRRPLIRSEAEIAAIPLAPIGRRLSPERRPIVATALAMSAPRPLGPEAFPAPAPTLARMPMITSALGGRTPVLAAPVPMPAFNPAASPPGGQ